MGVKMDKKIRKIVETEFVSSGVTDWEWKTKKGSKHPKVTWQQDGQSRSLCVCSTPKLEYVSLRNLRTRVRRKLEGAML
jgi:hypothetical protein